MLLHDADPVNLFSSVKTSVALLLAITGLSCIELISQLPGNFSIGGSVDELLQAVNVVETVNKNSSCLMPFIVFPILCYASDKSTQITKVLVLFNYI